MFSLLFEIVAKDTNNTSYTVRMEFDLYADICNVGSGFLGTYYMSFLQSPGNEGQN